MASSMRIGRIFRPAASVLHQGTTRCAGSWPLSSTSKLSNLTATSGAYRLGSVAIAPFHATSRRLRDDGSGEEPSNTDFSKLDVLGNVPIPNNSVDICMSNGFQFNSGARIADGSGAIVVGGEAFTWRPWAARGGEKRLLNQKGQWEVPNETLGFFELLWPRPDMLILGLGPSIRPISPQLRKYIGSLGMRVEILDTRNAASQFNLLATERGINEIAAALIPIGWKEGVGAN